MDYTLNCNGHLLTLDEPRVMGILNVTPDSFYAESRKQTEAEVTARVAEIVSQVGSIIDVGACSTRPGSQPASEEEETELLRWALAIVRREAPDAVVSIDTFRPTVARMAVEDFGADIINDVGNPAHDATDMFRMVSRLRVPYIYTSRRALLREVLMDCAEAVAVLRSMGQKDIIIDPGFGFGKTLEQNYSILAGLSQFSMLRLPILTGFSRKSMISKLLQCGPEQALNGTTVLNTTALLKGASILRVHDVREAVECIRIVEKVKKVKE